MTRAKYTKSAPLADFGADSAFVRPPVTPASLPPMPRQPRARYSRGPFYLKIEGLTGPRPTSEELNAGRGWK